MNPDLRPPDAPDSKLARTILLKSCKLADLAMQHLCGSTEGVPVLS